METETPKTLGCEVPDQVHREFKAACAREGLKLKEVMARLIDVWVSGEICLPKDGGRQEKRPATGRGGPG